MRGLAGLIEGLAIRGITRVMPALPEPRGGAEGFLVGYELDPSGEERGPAVKLPASERRKHLYVLGATGSGKTNFLLRLIEGEISGGQTCVVLDLRGDLVDRLLLRLVHSQSLPVESIALVDLREDGFFMPFNPLACKGDPYSRALHLLEVVRKGSESWGVQLEETLRNSLIALSPQGRCLTEIESLLEDADFRTRVLGGCLDPYVRGFFERYERLSPERRQSWSLPVLNKVTPFLSIPQLRRMLGSPNGFAWEDWIDRPRRLVLVALAAHRFHGASGVLGGLLVGSLQSSVMGRASRPESTRNPVTLFVDEFETMASPSFQTIVAEGRRFGLSLVLTHQNLSQVDPGLRQAIRNNVAVQLFFQTGALDASDLAGEIVTGEPRESVRQALLSQKVGEAFLVRRGSASLRVQTPHSPDPVEDPKAAREFKLAILESCGLPVGAAEEFAPSQGFDSLTSPYPEVRHEKRPKWRL